jgi:uncharacterized protein (DUF2336 family)
MADSHQKPESTGEINILDQNQLLKLAQDKSAAGRYQLAGAVSEFFDERDLSETEERIASEIILNLIRQAEIDLREALAERLSLLENVPPEVIVFLANDEISVASPVLQKSSVLNDVDLVYIIASKGPRHWRAIASRNHLSPIVADRLIETGDTKTVLNLLDNQRLVLQRGCLKKLVRAALKTEELAAPLLRRPEIEGDLVVDLYVCVSQTLRQEISRLFSIPPAAVEASLEDLIEELSHEAKGEMHVTPEMTALAKRFAERSEISPVVMIKTLRRGQISFFIALFAEKLGFTAEAVMRMIRKDEGRPFAVACRSTGMMKSEFATIFLLSRGIRSGDKIVDQRELAMALKYYDTLKDFDVQRLVKSWHKNPELI